MKSSESELVTLEYDWLTTPLSKTYMYTLNILLTKSQSAVIQLHEYIIIL